MKVGKNLSNTDRLIKKTGLYFIGNLSSKIIQAAILPIYAFFITPSDLGIFDYSQVWANIFSPICFLAIWEAILKFLIAEKDKDKIKRNISSILFFVIDVIVLTFVIVIILIRIVNIDNLVYILLMVFFMGLAHIWQYFARSLHKNKTYVVASIIGTIANFVFLLILVCIFKMGLFGLITSFIIGQAIIIIVIEYKVRILSYFNYTMVNIKVLGDMLKYSAPLVLNLTSMVLLNGFGRTIITRYLGPEANGLYTFAMKFGTLLSTLGSVISMAMCEEAILKINDPDREDFFSNVNTKLFRLFLSMCIMSIPAVTVFYHIIGKTGYYNSLSLVPLFLLNAVLSIMSTNIGTVFQATNNTHLIFTTTVAGTIVMICVSYFLIGKFGVIGVAIAQILGSATMMLCRWGYAKKLIDIKIKFSIIFVLLLIYAVMSVFSLNLGVIMNFVLFIIGFLVTFLLNKKDILNIILSIKNKEAK